jgi:hypothetical protein
MRKTAWILVTVLAMGTSLSAQNPRSSTLIKRPAQITVSPTPFERNKPVSAHVIVYSMPAPCADFKGVGTCSDNGKPVSCPYAQGLELRQYALKGTETVATEPKWESLNVGNPIGADLTGAQPAEGTRTERDFEALVAPTAAGESLFMILYRYCDVPRDPTKGPGTDRLGTRLGSAKYKLKCTGHLKKAVCAYWPD